MEHLHHRPRGLKSVRFPHNHGTGFRPRTQFRVVLSIGLEMNEFSVTVLVPDCQKGAIFQAVEFFSVNHDADDALVCRIIRLVNCVIVV